MDLSSPLTLIMDILTFGLGTYGAIVLVSDFVELDRFPTPRQALDILRKHRNAALALLIANLLFFLRIYLGLKQ